MNCHLDEDEDLDCKRERRVETIEKALPAENVGFVEIADDWNSRRFGWDETDGTVPVMVLVETVKDLCSSAGVDEHSRWFHWH